MSHRACWCSHFARVPIRPQIGIRNSGAHPRRPRFGGCGDGVQYWTVGHSLLVYTFSSELGLVSPCPDSAPHSQCDLEFKFSIYSLQGKDNQ
jgi:hypothetical protein